MTKREKRELAMRRNTAQIRFEQLHDLLVDNGFRYSINGSHYNYEHGRYGDIQPGVVKPHGGTKHVLPVYVKKALAAIDEIRRRNSGE